MTCKESEIFEQDFVAMLDDEIEPSRRTEIEVHLSNCADCRAHLAEIERTLAAVDSLPVAKPAPDLVQRFEERLEREQAGVMAEILAWLVRPRVLVGASLAACLLVLSLVVMRPGGSPDSDAAELAIAGQLDLFSDYDAIKNLDVLEDLEFIESLDVDS